MSRNEYQEIIQRIKQQFFELMGSLSVTEVMLNPALINELKQFERTLLKEANRS